MPRQDSIMGAASRRGWWGVRRLGLAVAVGVGVTLVASGVAVASPGNGASEFAPGHGGTPPGHGGTPPGHATIGQFDKLPAPPLDGAELAADQAKQTEANAYVARKALARTGGVLSRSLGVPLYQQPNYYSCGPTTLAMITTYLGVGYPGTVAQQVAAASYDLGTTTAGTAWYGADNVPSYPKGSWYPMQDALNWRLYNAGRATWYLVHALPGSPTDSDASWYMYGLQFDTDDSWPIAANQYSILNYQIGGQPNQTIQHWWATYGYDNYGWTTKFNDPAPWPVATQRSAPSWDATAAHQHTVVEALGGRGYIW